MNNSNDTPLVVMLGGGVESTKILHDSLAEGKRVLPLHISCGLIWDACESAFIQRFLEAEKSPHLLPLVEIPISLAGFLGNHWAVSGRGIPAAGAQSAELEIPLRNLLLLGLAVHRLRHLPRNLIALGTTADNCYRDGSRAYFDECEKILGIEAGREVRILTPLIGLHKPEIIRQSDPATLSFSFSCVNPRDGQHCGQCIKCGRRRDAFREAGVPDPTQYASK